MSFYKLFGTKTQTSGASAVLNRAQGALQAVGLERTMTVLEEATKRKPIVSLGLILRYISLIGLLVFLFTPRATGQEPVKHSGDNARVIVYRYAPGPRYDLALLIHCDGKKVVRLYKGRYVVLAVLPGVHLFRSNDKESQIELDLKPGQDYYLRLEEPHTCCRLRGQLTVVPHEQGIVELTNMEPALEGIFNKNFVAADQVVREVLLRKQIVEAARNGNLENVKALLQSNPELVLSKDDYGSTPLHWTASTGNKDMATLLLADNADANVKNNEGMTPLHWAAATGHKDIVDLLLANSADVNAKANDGTTSLDLAVDKGFKEVTELLLAKGADPEFVGLEEVVLLPVVDSRSDKKTKVDLDKIRKDAQKILAKRSRALAPRWQRQLQQVGAYDGSTRERASYAGDDSLRTN